MKNSNCDFLDNIGSVIEDFPETQKYYNEVVKDKIKNGITFNSDEDQSESHLDVECIDIELPNNSTVINDEDSISRHKNKGFKIENKWEGIIEEISDGVIYARMYDFETDSEDFAEFKIDDFDNVFVEENAEEGDRFFFYVGYSESPYRKNIGIISIRKYYVEKPSEKRINEILDKINRLKENFV